MILTDREIREAGIVQNIKPIKPGIRLSSGYSSFGFDPTLDEHVFTLTQSGSYVTGDKWDAIDVKRPKSITKEKKNVFVKKDDRYIELEPHDYVIGQTYETFHMPDNVMGVCVGKSTYARAGIIVNVTPLEPGWYGNLTLEISNVTENRVRLYIHEGICQIMFFRGRVPDQIYRGLYNGQTEPTLPRVRTYDAQQRHG